jgi:hypothetical protein
MPRRCSSWHPVSWIVFALGTLPAVALQAQAAPLPRWTITGALTTMRVGGQAGWGYGPELGIRRDVGGQWGIALNLAAPALRPDADGMAIDLGPTLTHVTRRTELGFSAGGTAFLVGDSSELTGGGLGLFAGGHATAWLAGPLGLVAATTLRYTSDGMAYPSLSGGIAVRF